MAQNRFGFPIESVVGKALKMGYTMRSNPEISSERYYIIILLLTSYQI